MAFCNNTCDNQLFVRHISRFIGEVVTIFTTSGGVSGCGFTGTLLSVNCDFVRIVTEMGFPPASPIAENICGDFDNGNGCNGNGNGSYLGDFDSMNGKGKHRKMDMRPGSVCDIPVDRIAAFCHNAV